MPPTRPVESDNDKVPVFEIGALNVGNRWVKVGALWEEVAKHTTGEVFLQGTIDDPSLAEPLPIALFGSNEDGFRVACRRPPARTGGCADAALVELLALSAGARCARQSDSAAAARARGMTHYSILPRAQAMLLEALVPTRDLGFTLYGGIAIALQIGHRESIDFGFFSAAPLSAKPGSSERNRTCSMIRCAESSTKVMSATSSCADALPLVVAPSA